MARADFRVRALVSPPLIRTTLDPFGWTSWIAVISGQKAFRLWPPNATHFYPSNAPKTHGVEATSIDTFNEVPRNAHGNANCIHDANPNPDLFP